MRKRLYRSRTDRMLSGVAGGMAQWLDLDPSLVRIVWVLLVLAGGAGFLLYIVAAIVIPEEPLGDVAAADAASGAGAAGSAGPTGATSPTAAGSGTHREGNAAIVFGAVLLFVGAWLLIKQYVPNLDDRFVWPSVLVVLGILLIAGSMRRGR